MTRRAFLAMLPCFAVLPRLQVAEPRRIPMVTIEGGSRRWLAHFDMSDLTRPLAGTNTRTSVWLRGPIPENGTYFVYLGQRYWVDLCDCRYCVERPAQEAALDAEFTPNYLT